MKIGQLLIALSVLAFTCTAQAASDPAAPAGMQQMQGKMQDMQALMDKIHKTEDPQERQRLMREHMKSMQQGMAMMGRMQGNAAAHTRECAQDDNECRMQRLQNQQQMMNQRMGMMQMMMEQMMGQMTQREADKAAPKPTDADDHQAHH